MKLIPLNYFVLFTLGYEPVVCHLTEVWLSQILDFSMARLNWIYAPRVQRE